MDGIALALLAHRASALCEEMGVVLRRTALSPNIKDRLDYSCALFDAEARDKAGQGGLARAKEFSWAASGQALDRLVGDMLNPSKSDAACQG